MRGLCRSWSGTDARCEVRCRCCAGHLEPGGSQETASSRKLWLTGTRPDASSSAEGDRDAVGPVVDSAQLAAASRAEATPGVRPGVVPDRCAALPGPGQGAQREAAGRSRAVRRASRPERSSGWRSRYASTVLRMRERLGGMSSPGNRQEGKFGAGAPPGEGVRRGSASSAHRAFLCSRMSSRRGVGSPSAGGRAIPYWAACAWNMPWYRPPAVMSWSCVPCSAMRPSSRT